MSKALPKGHVSCLSQSFRYTPAVGTDIAKTFARIRRTQTPRAHKPVENVCLLQSRKSGQAQRSASPTLGRREKG